MDDQELLFGNPVVDGSLPLSAAFDRDYFHHLGDAGQWRPLASLSLRLEVDRYSKVTGSSTRGGP